MIFSGVHSDIDERGQKEENKKECEEVYSTNRSFSVVWTRIVSVVTGDETTELRVVKTREQYELDIFSKLYHLVRDEEVCERGGLKILGCETKRRMGHPVKKRERK